MSGGVIHHCQGKYQSETDNRMIGRVRDPLNTQTSSPQTPPLPPKTPKRQKSQIKNPIFGRLVWYWVGCVTVGWCRQYLGDRQRSPVLLQQLGQSRKCLVVARQRSGVFWGTEGCLISDPVGNLAGWTGCEEGMGVTQLH